MRAARHVQVDACGRDRARKNVERHVADRPGGADVAAKVASAEREVDVPQLPARLADELAHPLAAELVAVAVEEDVVLLLARLRPEQPRVGGPVKRLRPARTALEQGRNPAPPVL